MRRIHNSPVAGDKAIIAGNGARLTDLMYAAESAWREADAVAGTALELGLRLRSLQFSIAVDAAMVGASA